MSKIIILYILSISIFFSGCSKDDNSDTTSANEISVDAEIVKVSAMKINDLTLKVDQNTYDTTSKMYKDINKTLQAFDKMSQSVLNTLDNGMKLANTLAQPFKISDDYTTLFALENNYTATTPAFTMSLSANKTYFLLSSQTKFYVENKTIKTYFKDASTLSGGWTRAISMADKNKDLYLKIVEIFSDGTSKKVTNSFLIKSTELQAL